MTREDIDRALLNVNVGKPATDAYETDLQVLARIVGEQERRLRVLEPCPSPEPNPACADLADAAVMALHPDPEV